MDSKTEFVYNGFAYRQSRDPRASWLISFVASAEELLTWAGIPRRASEKLVGFQRTDEPNRVERAKAFFDLGVNQSPTALIIGLHQSLEGISPAVRLEFLDDDESQSIRKCILRVRYDSREISLDSIRETIRIQTQVRLNQEQDEVTMGPDDKASIEAEEQALDSNQDEQMVAESDSDAADSASAESVEDDAEEEIELGRSLLRNLLEALEDIEWCQEHRDDLIDIAKPATVIDGQHRVLAARACERNMPFAVIALFNCAWPEQVFQFTVVNYTAKGIPDQFITANAALSLTRFELGELRTRLIQAGVKVVEYELMKVVQFDSRSPFYGLVNLTEKKDPSKIGYKTMVRLAKRWYNANHQVFVELLPNLYPDIKGAGAKKRQRDRWKEQDWGEFFLDFWKVVYENYKDYPSHEPDRALWDVGHSNLIVAIVLVELQEAFLDNLNQQDEEFFSASDLRRPFEELRDKIRKRAEKFVEWIPADFFGTRWGLGGQLSVGPGRIALEASLEKFVKTKGKYQYGKSTLVTGKTE